MVLQEIADSSSLRWIEVDNPSKAEIAARTKVFLPRTKSRGPPFKELDSKD